MSADGAGRVLRLAGLRVQRGGQAVLQGVDLQLDAGQTVALMGANGAGKSTLMAAVLGLLAIDGGSLQLFGQPLPARRRQLFAQVGVAFQSASVDDDLTVMENLCLGAALWGAGGGWVRRRAGQLAERLGLGARTQQRARILSGGLRRRLELGRALLHRPRLLLLDEAASGLDPQALGSFWQLIGQLAAEEQIAVLAATHLAEEAQSCQRLCILHRGRVVVDAPPAQLVAQLQGDNIELSCARPHPVAQRLAQRLQLQATVVQGGVQLQVPDAASLVPALMAAVDDLGIDALSLRRPGLGEVYLHHTGQPLAAPPRQQEG